MEQTAVKLALHVNFLDALSGLSAKDQGVVRAALSRVVAGYEGAGLRPHKVGEFVSYSPNMDLRCIGVRHGGLVTLVHVDHHDAAYRWAQRRGAVVSDGGLVALVENASRADDTASALQERPATHRFQSLPTAVASWLGTIRGEAELLDAISMLAPEHQELALAAAIDGAGSDWGRSANSNVVLIEDDKMLEFALRLPEDRWRIFLHPRQRFAVEVPNDRHVLLKGGPGTGKTVALVHRYARLDAESRSLGMDPPLLLAWSRGTATVLADMARRLGVPNPNLRTTDEAARRRGRDSLHSGQRWSAVLVDEGQDLPVAFIAPLLESMEAGTAPPHFIAFDANQAVFSPSGDALARLSRMADEITLNYCYRSTREIAGAAGGVLSVLHRSYQGKDFKAQFALEASRDAGSANMVSALGGPEVSVRLVDRSDVAGAVENALAELTRANPDDDCVVLVVGDNSGARRDLAEQARSSRAGTQVLRGRDAKGLEFGGGVVVDLIDHAEIASRNAKGLTPAAYRQLSELYVALSRFREQAVCVVTSSKSPLLRMKESLL